MLKRIIFSGLLILATVGCTITQRFQFELNYAGRYEMDFDITELAALSADSMDAVQDFFADMDLDSIKTYYSTFEGLSNITVSKTKNVLHLGYDFSGLAALNASLNTADSLGLQLGDVGDKFSVTNGIFKYDIGDFDENYPDSLAEVLFFVDYDILMNFAQEIESASGCSVLDDKQTIVMRGNFGDVVRNQEALKVEVSFKNQ